MLAIVFLFTSRGIYQKQIERDISILISDGLFKKTNSNNLINYLNSESKFDDKASLCMSQKSSELNDIKIQLPITGVRNSAISLFLFEQLHGYFNPMYSRSDFEMSLRGLKAFYGPEVVNNFFNNNRFYNKAKMSDYFLNAYSTISIQRLTQHRDNSNLRFYLLESKRDDLSDLLICKGDKYFVYDTSLIK